MTWYRNNGWCKRAPLTNIFGIICRVPFSLHFQKLASASINAVFGCLQEERSIKTDHKSLEKVTWRARHKFLEKVQSVASRACWNAGERTLLAHPTPTHPSYAKRAPWPPELAARNCTCSGRSQQRWLRDPHFKKTSYKYDSNMYNNMIYIYIYIGGASGQLFFTAPKTCFATFFPHFKGSFSTFPRPSFHV